MNLLAEAFLRSPNPTGNAVVDRLSGRQDAFGVGISLRIFHRGAVLSERLCQVVLSASSQTSLDFQRNCTV
jgi:hypothetical protein